MRLQLFQPFRADHLQSLHSVGDSPLVEGLQPGHFRIVVGHDHFAALIVLNLVFIAELAQGLGAAHTELSFLRVWPVIDTRMDDPAVVAGLVSGNLGVFLHHGDTPIGVLF